MGGDLRQKLAYGNHKNVMKYKEKVLQNAISDVVVGRAMAFNVEGTENILKGLRVLPVEVVEEKGEIRVIHDLTFEGPQGGASGDQRRLVNAYIDRGQVPGCNHEAGLSIEG